MQDLLRKVSLGRLNRTTPLSSFEVGDTVEVSVKVKEGEKERIQIYKGVVIKQQNSGIGRSFTVRKISEGVGVERTFPYASPLVEKVKVVARGRVRRGRLYYLRGLRGKKARLKTRQEKDGARGVVVPETSSAETETSEQA